MTPAEKIESIRKNRRLTYEELGAVMGCSGQAAANICRGEQTPSADKAARLAAALGVTVEWLWGDNAGDDPPPSDRDSLFHLVSEVLAGAGFTGKIRPHEGELIAHARQLPEPGLQRLLGFAEGLAEGHRFRRDLEGVLPSGPDVPRSRPPRSATGEVS